MNENILPYFDPDAVGGGDEFDFKEWSRLIHSRGIVSEAVQRADMLYKRKESVAGIPTGFKHLDVYLDGLQRGDLIVIGGRPSMGKTAFASSILERIVFEQKTNVAYFSMEMSRQQMMTRMLTSRARIDSHKLRSGFLSPSDWPRLTQAAVEFHEVNMFIDDTSPIFLEELREKSLWLKKNCDIKLVVIDYLQLLYDFIKADGSPSGIEKVVRALKRMAIDLDCPVILLSQLSRDVESREGFRPMLSDLPGNGAVAHSANVVMFLRREEYYEPTEENRGVTDVIIAKNNYGPLATAFLSFIREYMRFENIKDIDEEFISDDEEDDVNPDEDNNYSEKDSYDEEYDQAVRLVMETDQAAVSMLQRELGLEYERAARIIDMMEQRGIVGPYAGNKARTILVDREKWLRNHSLGS